MAWDDLDLLIIDQDPVRRGAIARIARELGVRRVQEREEWVPPAEGIRVPGVRVVLLDADISTPHTSELTEAASSGMLLVALVRSERGAEPELLAAGFGAVLYDPVTAVDLERIFALARTLASQGQERERRQFLRFNALRQVETDLALLAELSPDWMQRSLLLLQRILDVAALGLWRIDWEQDRLVCEGAVGLPEEFIRQVEERAQGRAAELVQRVLESLVQPVDMRPDSTDERVITDAAVRRACGLEAGLVVPVRRTGRVAALLSIYFRRYEEVNREEIGLFDAAAEALATAWAISEVRRELFLNQQQYRASVEEQPVGVLLCELNGTVRLANGAAARLLGYERPERLAGTRLPEVMRSLAPIPWEQWCQRPVGAPAAEATVPVLTLDKHLRIIEFHARVVELPMSTRDWFPEVQLVLRDVTLERRRLMELELLHDLTRMVSEDRNLDSAFEMVADRLQREFGYALVGLALLSADGTRFVGRAVRVEGGLTFNEWRADRGVTGRAVRENRAQLVVDVRQDPDYFDPQPDLPMESEVVAVLRREGKPIGVLNIESRRGHRLDQEDLRLALNVAVHLELLMRQVELTEQLERKALTDPLTGQPNRRALLDHLRRALGDRRVEHVAVILIDFDGFKVLNDTKGHLFGDALLQAVAERLARSLRPSDLLARYGGDEFAVVLAGVDLAVAHDIAERLRRAVADTSFQVRDEVVSLTISLGVAASPRHGDTPETLLRAADEALYAAKRRGGNSIAIAGEWSP